MFIATTITLLVTASAENQTAATHTTSITQAVTAELQDVASQPYANVAAASITAPNQCPSDHSASCVQVNGTTYTITYSVCPSLPTTACTSATGAVTEPSTTSGLPSAYTDVTATVTGLPIPPITQRVLAPFNTFATSTTGVLVTVDIASLSTGHNAPATAASSYSLYLLNQSNAQVAVATIGTGTVLFSVPSGSCLLGSPCHLGLSTGSGYDISPDGAYALRAGSALEQVVATTGSVVSVPAGIFAVSSPTVITLEAQNTGAATSPSSADINTVCIWGSFFDGTQNRVVPFCNASNAQTISLATYAPRASQPGVQFAIDPAAAITLSVDNPSGTCPNIGANVFSTSAHWVSGAECTSWTWGVPDGFGALGSLTPSSSGGVDTTPGINHTTGVVTSLVYNNAATDELLWSSLPVDSSNPGNVQGSPAAGFAGEPSWSKPRTTPSGGCSADATCGSLVGEVAPEASLCPQLNCLSTALFQPYLTSPKLNSVTMQNGAASFNLTVGDLDTAAPITTTITQAPSTGTLKIAGSAISTGQVLGTGLTGTSYALTYTANNPGSAPSDSFQVTLSNGQPGSAVLVTIFISNGQVVTTVTATPSSVTLPQGTSTSVTLHATDANGAAVSGAVLNLSSTVATTYDRYFPSALSVPSSVTTNSSGDATFSVAASSTANSDSGDAHCPCYGVTVGTALNGAITTVPVSITPAATSVIVSPDQNATTTSPAVVNQGGSVVVYGSVRDLTGGVIDTTPVTYSVSCAATGYTTCPYAGLVSVSPSSCTPASVTSNCAATLSVASTAPASVNGVVYTLTATSSVYSLSSSTTLTVRPVASTISFLTTPAITPGNSGTITVSLLDGAGAPLSNYNVSLASSTTDLTFTNATLATNSSGVATFTDHANSAAQPETVTLTATASTISSKYPSYAPTITTTGSLTVNLGVPTITSVAPSSGPGEGGNTSAIIVTGTNFTGATTVNFGSTPASSFTVNSSTSITIPVGSTPNDAVGGTVDVRVTNGAGTSSIVAGDQYTYIAAPTITSLTPVTGPDVGATSVAITGTGFTGATAVHFGATSATTYTVNSSTSITATAPQHAAGTVDVTVTTSGGPNVTTAADHYTYVAQSLTITAQSNSITFGGSFTQGATTATLLPGDAVTVTYTYTGTGSTTYGPTTVVPVNAGTYSVTPSLAIFSPGTASNYAITYVAGTLTINQAALTLSFGTAPTGVVAGETPGTHSVTATSSPAATGTIVFSTATPAVCTVNAATGALTPLTSGTCTIDANDSGSSNYAAASQVAQNISVAPQAPTVTAVSPASGFLAGGTSVTLTGTYFTSASAVHFGATLATSFTVNSATSISVTSPAASLGTVDVTVTTPGGTSATSSADHFTYVTPLPTITSVSPTYGTAAGGTSVTITGTNLSGTSVLDFGATPATTYTVNSSTSITATSPAEAAGVVDVTATTLGGTSATSSADHFTFATVPGVVTNISGNGTDNVSAFTDTFTAPVNNGGAPITDYKIRYSTDNATWTTVDTGSTATSYYLAVPSEVTYYTQVAAVNVVGQGSWSVSNTVYWAVTTDTYNVPGYTWECLSGGTYGAGGANNCGTYGTSTDEGAATPVYNNGYYCNYPWAGPGGRGCYQYVDVDPSGTTAKQQTACLNNVGNNGYGGTWLGAGNPNCEIYTTASYGPDGGTFGVNYYTCSVGTPSGSECYLAGTASYPGPTYVQTSDPTYYYYRFQGAST